MKARVGSNEAERQLIGRISTEFVDCRKCSVYVEAINRGRLCGTASHSAIHRLKPHEFEDDSAIMRACVGPGSVEGAVGSEGE